MKFTERGSVTVHVSAQSETEQRVRLKFSIRDTGIGIPPEAQARIFESFHAGRPVDLRARFGGTGLGTTIAKQIVGLMGGAIGMESAVGLGRTFWFEIALDKQSERAGTVSGDSRGRGCCWWVFRRPARAVGRRARRLGRKPGGRWRERRRGRGALVAEISLAKPYHSALLYSPGADPGLAQRFRRAAPDPAPPTVLAVPRDAGVQRFEALSAGFSAVLELPVDKRQLFNVLHSVFAGDEPGEGVVRLQDYARRTVAKGLRVLVADDNPTNREVIGRILERGGHAVTLVQDGEQALDAQEREPHDVVILDRNMPGLGGIETLQALRLLTRGALVPVIMLSAPPPRRARSSRRRDASSPADEAGGCSRRSTTCGKGRAARAPAPRRALLAAAPIRPRSSTRDLGQLEYSAPLPPSSRI